MIKQFRRADLLMSDATEDYIKASEIGRGSLEIWLESPCNVNIVRSAGSRYNYFAVRQDKGEIYIRVDTLRDLRHHIAKHYAVKPDVRKLLIEDIDAFLIEYDKRQDA